jgi:hypothetical protein
MKKKDPTSQILEREALGLSTEQMHDPGYFLQKPERIVFPLGPPHYHGDSTARSVSHFREAKK